ncbi:MAG TPA: amino acid ABC transporter substrate-binding protein [Gammaproteobacteria bacterium]|jgi:polar amino acid transport system substrate-binding protein|nr:amino acid ABC transporter substrate-binding protein [Acidiferrobacter sp.]MED5532643.1 transporter substrate-binding domain-containing protein [Pseudomonadota bacterium]HAA36103.1 amino acid ABC transporter substrate-binding protein [Gammaproteobacteria bacterium]HAF74359.1 amino acid ABC transporter substrate-binding protein [Gammaproteobacteria bacterium]|tara:strand:- start:205 stop:1047 length:843 start_codon:yes stop_codon:yes gene_type:complete
MQLLKKVFVGAVTFLGIALAPFTATAGDLQQQLTSESVIETITKRGKMKVGMSTFVPWAMRDKQGELIGFEIDVAKKVAADLGVEIEFVPTAWSGIIPALIAGNFDVIIGGMSVTPKRNMTINFTAPYAHSGMGIVANKELAGGLAWPDGYNSSKVTFTCRRGATSCTDTQKLFPKAKLRQFDDSSLVLQEVVNGNAHAVLTSFPKPTLWQAQNADVLFNPSLEKLTEGNEAFGVRKGDPDALNVFSNWIMVNTSNGWLQERWTYWFTTMDWADQVNLKK